MRSRRGVNVVGLVGMSKLSVRECSLDRAADDIGGDDRRNLDTLKELAGLL